MCWAVVGKKVRGIIDLPWTGNGERNTETGNAAGFERSLRLVINRGHPCGIQDGGVVSLRW